MLKLNERRIVFAIFCLATLTCLGLEAYLVVTMIGKGFSSGSTVAAVMNTMVLGGIGVLFKKLVEDTFVKPELLPMDRLHQLATTRNKILETARRNKQDVLETRKALVTDTLQFIEKTLHGWVPGAHFELCVFVGAKEPVLFSYFDSNHDTVARSMALRDENPKFYIEQGYEVTKVLAQPTSQPRIIGDTHDAKSGYSFTTKEQQNQIKSSVLLSLDLERPLALVLSSDEKGAFGVADQKLMPFIRYVGELIHSDLIDVGIEEIFREKTQRELSSEVSMTPLMPDAEPIKAT